MKGGDSGCKSSWGLCVRVCGCRGNQLPQRGLRRPATTMMMLDGWPPSCVGRGTAAAAGRVNVGGRAAQHKHIPYTGIQHSYCSTQLGKPEEGGDGGDWSPVATESIHNI